MLLQLCNRMIRVNGPDGKCPGVHHVLCRMPYTFQAVVLCLFVCFLFYYCSGFILFYLCGCLATKELTCFNSDSCGLDWTK